MNLKKRVGLLTVIIIGTIIPFITSVVVFEIFYLLIPLGLVFIGTLIYLLICVFEKSMNTKKAAYTFLIVPTFILAQVFSGLTVNKIQKYRSQTIITKLKKLKEQTGELPESFSTPLGIDYERLREEEYFKLEFSPGFMITEQYDSKTEKWESFGWND